MPEDSVAARTVKTEIARRLVTIATSHNIKFLKESAESKDPLDRLVAAINPNTATAQVSALQNDEVTFVREAAKLRTRSVDESSAVEAKLLTVRGVMGSESRPVLRLVIEREYIPAVDRLIRDLGRLKYLRSWRNEPDGNIVEIGRR